MLDFHADDRKKFDLFEHLRLLKGTKLGDWPVILKDKGLKINGRICAIRKSRQATEKARDKARAKASRSGKKIMPETLEAAGYVFVFTTIGADLLNATSVLEMYRGRWQVEVVFKRLKSIMALGHLRKTDWESARSWIHGKLLVALLVEALIRKGETFSPWGYPILDVQQSQPLPVERREPDAAPSQVSC